MATCFNGRGTSRRCGEVFEGSMTDTEVRINGKKAGATHEGGFYRFSYDISGLLDYGKANTFAQLGHNAVECRAFVAPRACRRHSEAYRAVGGARGSHEGGFYRFSYDISGLLDYGKANTLEVSVKKCPANPSVYRAERQTDFWLFGGIYRPVYIEVKPTAHIDWGRGSGGGSGRFRRSFPALPSRSNMCRSPVFPSRTVLLSSSICRCCAPMCT